MKPRILNTARLSFPLAAAIAALLGAPAAMAQTNRYWDPASSGSFGTVNGTITWTSPLNLIWTNSNTGGTTRLGNYTTTLTDICNFGGPTASLGVSNTTPGTTNVIPVGTVNAGSLSFNTLGGNLILSGGTITLAASSTITTVNASQAHTITSVLAGAGTSLTKAGAGTLSLSGANTYSGATNINSGTVVLGNAAAFQNTSAISMGAGTTLRADVSASVSAPITLGGAGDITLSVGTTSAKTPSFSGGISGTTGNLIFTSQNNSSNPAHIIDLGGAGTYAGNTTLTTGNSANNITLRNSSGAANALPATTVLTFGSTAGSGSGRSTTFNLNGQDQTLAGLSNSISTLTARNHRVTNSGALATLTINGSADSSFGGAGISTTFNGNPVNPTAQITGAIALTKDGSGRFTLLGGAGNTYTGLTTVNGGFLRIEHGNSLGDAATGTSVAPGATLEIANNITVASEALTLNGTGVGGTNGALRNVSGTNAINGAITLGGDSLINSAGGTLTLGGGITGTGFGITKSGTGALVLNAASDYTGLTTVSGGALRIADASALGSTASGTVVNATSSARLELSGDVTVTGESLTINGSGNFIGALTSSSGNNVWAGSVTIGSAGTRLGASDGTSLEVSGVIDSGASAHGLVIRTTDLTGSVILSGANTYLGDTQVLIGKLQLDGGDNRLPVGTNLLFSSNTTNGGAELDLNGRNQEVAGISISGGADVTLNGVNNNSATLSTLTVNTAAASPSSHSGYLKGNLALTKTGADLLTLDGTNSYSGATTVNGGTLLINGNSSTATGAVAVNAGTLGGTGRTGGAATVAALATLSPGASIESFDVASLDMAATSVFAYEVADRTATGADLLAVRGALALSDVTLSLDSASLLALAGAGWVANDKLTLISYFDAGAGITSGFDGYADDSTVMFGSNEWLFDYNDTVQGGNFGADAIAGSQNRFVTLTAVNVIPEPSAALLGGLGALLLLRRRRV